MSDEKRTNHGVAKRMLQAAISRIERELVVAYDNSIYMNAVRPIEGTDPSLVLVEDAVATEQMRNVVHLKGNLSVYQQALVELIMED